MGFYIRCPFFVHQQYKRPTISCEDCVRLFESNETKFKHIKTYCEEDWQHCEYAASLIEIYEGTVNMNENESKTYVAEKELEQSRDYNKKLLSDIGRKNKHIEKLEKTIADMNDIAAQNNQLYRQELNALRNRATNLEKQKSWAESILGALLIKQAGPSQIVKLDLNELGRLMTEYRLQFEIDQERNVATAKIEKNEKEKSND